MEYFGLKEMEDDMNPKCTLTPQQVETLARPFIHMADAIKKQRRHDFLVATYGIIGGIISGVASSLIVLWLQGLL